MLYRAENRPKNPVAPLRKGEKKKKKQIKKRGKNIQRKDAKWLHIWNPTNGKLWGSKFSSVCTVKRCWVSSSLQAVCALRVSYDNNVTASVIMLAQVAAVLQCHRIWALVSTEGKKNNSLCFLKKAIWLLLLLLDLVFYMLPWSYFVSMKCIWDWNTICTSAVLAWRWVTSIWLFRIYYMGASLLSVSAS